MDTNAIEKKWSSRWAEAKAFESDPDKSREKRYLTAAFPYPNSPQHIGHARTYTTADIYARYLRLKGYNVLFPMAFHVTGTPILAMAKRIAAGDENVLSVFDKIYGIPPEKAKTLDKPRELVTYFSKEIEEGMKEMGFSMDWRRKFYTYDEKFNLFIQWQFRKLKELGYLIKGEYPIAWCPSDGNALSAHDTKGDVDPELEDVTVIKFALPGKEFLVVTTYRPETVYGVTNIWVNPKAEYVKVRYKGQTLIMAKAAAEVLKLQMGHEPAGELTADEILKMTPKNPVNGQEVPVYPASFVSPETGTGIVMSVPAHAPKDYLALRDLGKGDIEMPQVIELKGYSKNPARDAVDKLKVKNQDDPDAEKATKEIYTKEAHEGVMLAGKYRGQKVADAKVNVAEDLKKENQAFGIITIANGPVYCRCGSHAVVNIMDDQWFIDYGIPEWKEKARKCLGNMGLIPENTRSEFEYTVEWLKTRPTTRSSGLGTKFPFDESKMIEALSDSTLYMSYYTIAHLLADVEPSKLDEKFFDYVFLGKGEGNDKMDELRASFLYWYPCDSRHSAGDLVRNHLTLYIFNHVGIYEDEKLWPKQIVTNGFVTMEGSKMSKSMGNIMPLRKAIQEYGADVIRFAVVCGADLASDSDFNKSVADGVRSRLNYVTRLIEATKKQDKKPGRAERWLHSRINRKIKRANELYENLHIRHLALEIFYDTVSDLQWYMKRTKEPDLHHFFEKWVPLITPFMPHYCEEYWEKLGKEPFVSFTPFPEADESKIDDNIEKGEELIGSVHEDIEKISGIIGKKPSKVTVYIASQWKRKLFNIAREKKNFQDVMKSASTEGLPMKEAQGVMKQIMKNVHSLPQVLSSEEELDTLKDAREFLSAEFECEIDVYPEEDGKHPKAKAALPGKPAIMIE
jgi:leucyl-tRNA synthetase